MDQKVMLKVAPFIMNVSTSENQSVMISGWFFGFPQKEYTAEKARYQFRVYTSADPASDWNADEYRWLGPIPDAFIRKLLEIYLQGYQGVTE